MEGNTMETLITGLAVFVVSYLLGSISFSWIAMRLLSRGEDVGVIEVEKMKIGDKEMSLPMSANSVSMKHDSRAGMIVSLLDIIKGFAVTLAARLIFLEQPYYLLAALGVVTGHNWPVYFRFVGGSGIATIMGVILVIDWLSIPVAFIVSLVVGLLLLRHMGAVFVVFVLTFIPWMWLCFGDVYHVLFAILLLALFSLSMVPTIRVTMQRMKDGTKFENTETIMETMPMGSAS
jgi:glycerol-3-phosphate acyltransferase PlsY